MDVIRNSLERFKIGDVIERVASLLQERGVDDDAKGLIAVRNGFDSAGFIVQVVLIGGHFLVDRRVGQIQHIVVPIGETLRIAALEERRCAILAHLRVERIRIGAGSSSDHLYRHAGLFGVSRRQLLPCSVSFRLKVEVIHGTGSRSGRFRIRGFGRLLRRSGGISRYRRLGWIDGLVGIAANACKNHHGRKENCQSLFHCLVPFVK